MPKRRLALWLLNRVAGSDWNRSAMLRALRHPILGLFGGNDVSLGQRADLPASEAGILMYEGADADEYFVPITVKCIGDPALLAVPSSGSPTLTSILAFYSHHYGAGARFPWASYWEAARNPSARRVLPDVRMVSDIGVGYYRMLQDFTRRNPGCRHVLVGYSQGGLVARYLAYLDEHVFGNELIDGVVMLDTPNFGSPLARPANAINVMQSLALVLAGTGQLDEATFPGVAAKLRGLASAPRSVDLAWLLDFLDDALTTLVANPHANKKKPGLFSFLATARKWLSGLESVNTTPNPVFAHEESAFFDLDLELLPKNGSVLNAVNSYPLEAIKHAAIVGTDNQLDSFIEAAIRMYADGQGWLAGLLGGLLVNKLKKPLQGFFKIAGDAYKDAMREQGLGAAPAPTITARLDDFSRGVESSDRRYGFRTRFKIAESAHDFVIPSAYQLVEKQTPACLGNWVNRSASHLSGADAKHDGKTSQGYLLEILKQI